MEVGENMFFCDVEVFEYDWIVVFKQEEHYEVFHNDNYGMKLFLQDSPMLGTFNGKHYDQYIIKAILAGADNALIKEINDHIIGGGMGFEHWFLQQNRIFLSIVDIRDDMQRGLSLKAIEGHLNMPIRESTVPFTINRPLTEQELVEVIEYCKYDVSTTEELFKIRSQYLTTKINVGNLNNIPPERALYCTNAKLVASFLGAVETEWLDKRDYEYPEELDKSYIPPEVIEFFDRITDFTVPDDELFKSNLKEVLVGDTPTTFGFGGVHGGYKKYYEKSTEERAIKLYDVASMYPALMINYNYLSRSIPSAGLYADIRERRIKAKEDGDMLVSDALKLVLNITYGATLNQYNALYDPKNGLSVCVSGQLFLTELAMRYVEACPSVKIININTDGVMISIDRSELDKIAEINAEWEERTRFVLEEDDILEIIQKDVNNYIAIESDGRLNTVGGYLFYGISERSGWTINNSATIVKKALLDYFAKGIPVRETVEASSDIFDFQIIAKAGTMYNKVYHLVNDEKIPVQKVNRVYSTSDSKYGRLYKVKEATGAQALIELLPDHCIIDNENELTIDQIDREFYIKLAERRVKEFVDTKFTKERSKNMPNTEVKNEVVEKKAPAKKAEVSPEVAFFKKLVVLRNYMADAEWSKEGINTHQQYKYIKESMYKLHFKNALRKADLLWEMNIDDYQYLPSITDKQHMIICNFTGALIDPDTGFSREYRIIGSGADAGDKAIYKAITGAHKYFLSANFNVAEDNDPEKDSPVLGNTAPASPAVRKEIKNKLTNPKGKASELQVRTLESILQKLVERDAENQYIVDNIMEGVGDLTSLSKEDCESLIIELGEMI